MTWAITILVAVLVTLACGILGGALYYRMWGHVALNTFSIVVGVAIIAMLHS